MIMDVYVRDIRKGMYAASHVYSDRGVLLVSKGTKLGKNYVSLLRNIGIDRIPVSFEPLPDDKSDNDSEWLKNKQPIMTNVSNKPVTGQSDFIHELIMGEARILIEESLLRYGNSSIDGPKRESIKKLLMDLINKKQILDCLLEVRFIDHFTFIHSINVAALSLYIATAMNMGQEETYKIAIGGLLHDIGKKRVPLAILMSENQLTPEEKIEIEKHTSHGYDYLIRQQNIPEDVALICIQHHERLDGSGYPYRSKGSDIHIYSQIIGIADIYEAMTSNRNYRKGYNPVEVFEYLMAVPGTMFVEDVVKALLGSVAVYKIGSVVQLSDGELGMVIKSNPQFPTRPVVRIIFNSYGLRLRKPMVMDLSNPDNTKVQVIRSFG